MQHCKSDTQHWIEFLLWKEEPWCPAVISPEYCLTGSANSVGRQDGPACVCVIEWVNFMNENSSSRAVDRRWDHLIEWRIPPLDLLSYSHQPRLAPVLMNPINVHYGQKHAVVVTWMVTIQNMGQQEKRIWKLSIVSHCQWSYLYFIFPLGSH